MKAALAITTAVAVVCLVAAIVIGTRSTAPASPYNYVCNSRFLNSSGVMQTYYFPCTDRADIDPHPGG